MSKRIARLVQLQNFDREHDGATHVVVDGSTIGRARDNDVHLEDEGTSRRHARIEWRRGEPVVRDLGSLNGTWLGNDRVVEEAPLVDGALLKIGRNLLRFKAGAPSSLPPVVPPPAQEGGPSGGAAPAQVSIVEAVRAEPKS